MLFLHARRRNGHEAFANPDGAEPAHDATYGFLSLHRDPTGGWPLLLRFASLRNCGIQRWLGRIASPQTASADAARTVSRSHCRQIFVEHHVFGAFDFAKDTVEIYCTGFQPRYF